MFTGIIEETGTLNHIEVLGNASRLIINAGKVLHDCKDGDSIAVNGVCLTVTQCLSDAFVADAVAETMRRTNLGGLKVGDKVNLERSLRLNDRLGGHIVAGHVDEVGSITSLRPEGISTIMSVGVSKSLMKYIPIKGSVCVDGVSLTVTDISDSGFQVSLIPFTKDSTTFGLKRVGDSVNIEVDMLARYIERLMTASYNERKSGIDQDFLKDHGFI